MPADVAAHKTTYRHSAFGLLIAGQVTSKLGHAVFLIVLTLYLKQLTDSARVLGAAQFLSYLPALLLGPFAGVLVDRFDRKRLLVGSDLARGAAIMLVAAAARYGGAATVVLLFVLAALVSICQAVFLPTVQALLPDVVPPQRLRSRNAVRGAGVQLANLAGNAAGGMLFAAFGGPVVLLYTGVTFLLSAAQEQLIRVPRRPPRAHAAGIGAQTVSALRYVRVRPGVAAAVVTHGVVGLSFPPLLLALPFVVMDDLGLPESFFGFYLAAVLAGGILGYLWFGSIRSHRVPERTLLLAGFMLLALGVSAAGVWMQPIPLFPAFTAAGLGAGMVNLALVTALQRSTPSARRGRVFGLYESTAAAASALGFALAGPLVDLFRDRLSVLVLAVGIALILYWARLLWSPAVKKLVQSPGASSARESM